MSSNALKVGATPGRTQAGPKNVRITDNAGHVDQNDVTISGQDQVVWTADTNSEVRFDSPDGSPFAQSRFQVPARGSVSSGPVSSNAQPKRYKYTVVGEGGHNDPGVIIQR
ncbi:MAG TPA: hypothetical protein VHN74_06535 [Candidatus Angelobacter sp.]|jgi:hypothetical protein|nr:hypothetical protein [Candidatus Angelobacter sp.]